MTYPQNIIVKFGGLRAMARLTGYPNSTISSWLSRGAIHDEHKPAILEAGLANGVAIQPDDFFPTGGDAPTADP
jgi:hypothetical protein